MVFAVDRWRDPSHEGSPYRQRKHPQAACGATVPLLRYDRAYPRSSDEKLKSQRQCNGTEVGENAAAERPRQPRVRTTGALHPRQTNGGTNHEPATFIHPVVLRLHVSAERGDVMLRRSVIRQQRQSFAQYRFDRTDQSHCQELDPEYARVILP
jgi:hypothetical protein